MKSVFYVDVYFILNFIINLFLICLTAAFRQKKCRFLRLAVFAGVSAGISVFLYLFFFGENWILAGGVPVQIFLLVYFSFPFEGWMVFLKDAGTLLVLACFSGGVITAVLNVCRKFWQIHSVLWFLAAFLLCFVLLYWLRFELLAGWKKREQVCMVKLSFQGQTTKARALFDTGNQLVSPYTGEGVVVIAKDLAGVLGLKDQKYQLIPYHSIGGSGLLKAFRIDTIEIIGKKEKRENVLVAVSDTMKETADIKVILNALS